jgi:hypothetical protein
METGQSWCDEPSIIGAMLTTLSLALALHFFWQAFVTVTRTTMRRQRGFPKKRNAPVYTLLK